MSIDGVIEHVRAGERPSAKKYNSLVDFANNAQRAFGAAPTQSSGAPCLAGDVTVRYETSDSELKLKGLKVSDDITAKAGELILVHRETEDDGVYSIQDGSWVRLYRFNFPIDRKEVWGKWELALFPGALIRVWHDQSVYIVTLIEKNGSVLGYIWAAIPICAGGNVFVLCATWKNTGFPQKPDTSSDSFDEVEIESEFDDKKETQKILFWQQDDPDNNGIYSYSKDSLKRAVWTLEKKLNYAYLKDKNIIVLRGKRWGNMTFRYSSENHVIPIFSQPFPVDIGSKESETKSGLSEMACGETPAEGDMVWVSGSGLYIAMDGAWTQVAASASDNNPSGDVGSIISQENEVLVGVSCVDDAIEGEFEFHEYAISPTKLTEAPEE